MTTTSSFMSMIDTPFLLERARVPLGRVTSEDEVPGGGLVTGKAGLVHRLVGGFAVVEMGEPPAAGRGVFLRVLDHELDAVLGRARHERLVTAEDFVVFRRGDVIPREPGDDRAVRERALAFAKCFDRDVVAQDGADVVEVALLLRDGDQAPVAVSGRER